MEKLQATYHRKPYVKQYVNGILINPITKENPYFVYPKNHIAKTKKKPTRKQYVQEIPVFVNLDGKEQKLRNVFYTRIDGIYIANYKHTYTKRIIHEKN